MPEYTFGKCSSCGKLGALKDGKCSSCQIEVTDLISKLFGKLGGKDE